MVLTWIYILPPLPLFKLDLAQHLFGKSTRTSVLTAFYLHANSMMDSKSFMSVRLETGESFIVEENLLEIQLRGRLAHASSVCCWLTIARSTKNKWLVFGYLAFKNSFRIFSGILLKEASIRFENLVSRTYRFKMSWFLAEPVCSVAGVTTD